MTTIDITETNPAATGMSDELAAVLLHAMIETAAGKEKGKENAIEIEIVIETGIIIIANGDMIDTLVVTETAVAKGNKLTVNEDGHEKRIEIQSAKNPEKEIKTETVIVSGAGTETEAGTTTDPDLDVVAPLPNQPALAQGTIGSDQALARLLEDGQLPGGDHALLVNWTLTAMFRVLATVVDHHDGVSDLLIAKGSGIGIVTVTVTETETVIGTENLEMTGMTGMFLALEMTAIAKGIDQATVTGTVTVTAIEIENGTGTENVIETGIAKERWSGIGREIGIESGTETGIETEIEIGIGMNEAVIVGAEVGEQPKPGVFLDDLYLYCMKISIANYLLVARQIPVYTM